MDRERFDALARVLGTSGSRRGTIGALMGGALFGVGLTAEAKKPKKSQKSKSCFGDKTCEFPEDGKKFDGCNLAGTNIHKCNGCSFRNANLASANFDEGSFQGASFREANLRSADFAYADVSGVSFRDACLVDADFTGANIDGASFRGSIRCATLLPDGSVDDSGCDKVNNCCQPCLLIGQACGAGVFGKCCGGTSCVNGQCSFECLKDTDCPEGEFCCENQCGPECCDGSQCPQGLCSQGQCVECINSDDCSSGFVCCADGGCHECCNDFSGQCGDGHCCNLVCQECCDNQDCPFDLECVEGICVGDID